MAQPSRKNKSFIHRLPLIENSSTMTSVHAIYTKDPAAMEEKMTSTSSPAPLARMPMIIPRGDAHAKVNRSQRTILKLLGKVFTREMPRADEAAPLWIAMAMIIETVDVRFCYNPRASPSKTACTESAIIRMKGVMLQHLFFRSSLSTTPTSMLVTSSYPMTAVLLVSQEVALIGSKELLAQSLTYL